MMGPLISAASVVEITGLLYAVSGVPSSRLIETSRSSLPDARTKTVVCRPFGSPRSARYQSWSPSGIKVNGPFTVSTAIGHASSRRLFFSQSSGRAFAPGVAVVVAWGVLVGSDVALGVIVAVGVGVAVAV